MQLSDHKHQFQSSGFQSLFDPCLLTCIKTFLREKLTGASAGLALIDTPC